MIRIKKFDSVTPIEEYHGLLFKRDDYYLPYEDYPELGGGKVRQMQAMFMQMVEKSKWIPGLITHPVSLSSPQSAIVAKVAKDNNVPCIVCIGGKINSIEETISKYKPLTLSNLLGAKIMKVANIGYSSAVSYNMNIIAKENGFKVVDFGINLTEYPEAIIGSTANQVKNLPNEIDNLIIPCGSALTMAGIIIGVEQFKKRVKRIIGIQICDRDRIKSIDSILNQFGVNRKYEFIPDKTYSYQKNIEHYISSNFELNVKYESKAFLYFLRNQKQLNITASEKTLFWCVGNNNFLFY